jgi:hypothetical protein
MTPRHRSKRSRKSSSVGFSGMRGRVVYIMNTAALHLGEHFQVGSAGADG